MGFRRHGSLKKLNQKHADADADADGNTGVTTIALPVLCTGELKIKQNLKMLVYQPIFESVHPSEATCLANFPQAIIISLMFYEFNK